MSELSMRIAVAMEAHAAMSTTTKAKAEAIDEILSASTPPAGVTDADVVRVGDAIARAFHQEHREVLSQWTRSNLARAALSAPLSLTQAAQPNIGEALAEVGVMPGTTGFTIVVFKADKVPVGTMVYACPSVKP